MSEIQIKFRLLRRIYGRWRRFHLAELAYDSIPVFNPASFSILSFLWHPPKPFKLIELAATFGRLWFLPSLCVGRSSHLSELFSLILWFFDSLILWFFDSLILEFGSASAAQKLDWNLLSFQCRSPAIQKAGPSSREGRKEPSKEELEHNGRSSPVFGTASDPIIMHKHTHARTHAIRWWADGWATDAFRNSGNPSHWKSFRSMASKRKREERKGEGIKANWDEMTQEDGWMFFYRPSGPQLRVQNGREECF